jgi:hypothetical protein
MADSIRVLIFVDVLGRRHKFLPREAKLGEALGLAAWHADVAVVTLHSSDVGRDEALACCSSNLDGMCESGASGKGGSVQGGGRAGDTPGHSPSSSPPWHRETSPINANPNISLNTGSAALQISDRLWQMPPTILRYPG